MKTATSLALIAIGAILTFAITGHPSFLNLQVAGVVVMATGVAGLFLPKRGQAGWLRRRMVVRKGGRGPLVGQVEETRYPPYIMLNPGAEGEPTAAEAAREPGPTPPDLQASDHDPATTTPGATINPGESQILEEYIQE
jgi:hypothetical protein